MKEPSVVVVGGVNMDIGGRPNRPLIDRDSNPGRVWHSVGGVGFNIACNLSLLGMPVTFLTAMGQDMYGERVAEACGQAGMNISRAIREEGAATSVYLFIADERGDMRLAVSDMDICGRVTPEYLAKNRDALDGAEAIVLDANLPEESIRYLAETCQAPLFADPVSVSKAGRMGDVLGRLHTLKPNRLEAELLSGMAIRGPEDLDAAADKLLATGLKRVLISMGGEGVHASEAGRHLRVPCCPAEALNTTGAGDAFMAGLVYSHLRGFGLEQAARTASAAAAIAVEGARTINPALSVASLEKKLNELEKE